MRIGITGYTGYIGRFLINKLSKYPDHKVFYYNSKNLDITKEIEFPELDVIVHLAGYVKRCLFSKDDQPYFHINAIGTANVIKAAINSNIKRIVFSSSNLVYKNLFPIISVDDELGENSVGGTYGLSKLVAENLIKKSGLSYSILRISSPYTEDGKGMIKGAYWDLLNNKVYLHPCSVMNFVPMEKVIDEIIKSIFEDEGNVIKNVFGKSISLLELYDKFKYPIVKIGGEK